jgi:hypothetical protein
MLIFGQAVDSSTAIGLIIIWENTCMKSSVFCKLDPYSVDLCRESNGRKMYDLLEERIMACWREEV